jgi:hypothetical protein
MKPASQNSHSLQSAWKEHRDAAPSTPQQESERDRAATLREYEKLLDQVNEVLKEQESERRIRQR